ncbi:MAG TPA: AbrB/MazE/SpoVT family DNA-binding domain-containing protein [Chthonomonadaceae bacterium]|nr:AbrB/MazE/SpoVT family DNA-binding domain-containing protein [Chthonomonadaceae bacterium]
METTVEIARRGQITIPKNLRDSLGIQEGSKYGLRALEGGILVLTPRGGQANAARKQLRDSLIGKGASLDEMLAELRRMREAGNE